MRSKPGKEYEAGKQYVFPESLVSLKSCLRNVEFIHPKDEKEFMSVHRQGRRHFVFRVPDPIDASILFTELTDIPEAATIGVTDYTFERRQICIDVWECVRVDR